MTLSNALDTISRGDYDASRDIEDMEGALCSYKTDNSKQEEKVITFKSFISASSTLHMLFLDV